MKLQEEGFNISGTYNIQHFLTESRGVLIINMDDRTFRTN